MATATKGKKVIRKRRERKNVEKGQVHIRSSFNNTMVTVTRICRATPCPGPPPAPGIPRFRKSTPFAAQTAAETAAQGRDGVWPEERGGLCQGPGAGREAAIRALQAVGLEVTLIKDVTPVPPQRLPPPEAPPRLIWKKEVFDTWLEICSLLPSGARL